MIFDKNILYFALYIYYKVNAVSKNYKTLRNLFILWKIHNLLLWHVTLKISLSGVGVKKIEVQKKKQWIFLSVDMKKAGNFLKNGVNLVFGVIFCEF